MLYFVGDSNSVNTSKYFRGEKNAKSLCAPGLDTDQILIQVRKIDSIRLKDAIAFFVFCGMNNRKTGEDTAENITSMVKSLRSKVQRDDVPIFIALPFCVYDKWNSITCNDRRDAARILSERFRAVVHPIGVPRTVVIDLHVDEHKDVNQEFIKMKGPTKRDTLHLNDEAYQKIAEWLETWIEKWIGFQAVVLSSDEEEEGEEEDEEAEEYNELKDDPKQEDKKRKNGWMIAKENARRLIQKFESN